MIDNRFFITRGPFPLRDLLTGLTVDMPPESFSEDMIRSAAPLEQGKSGDISFLGSRKNKAELENSNATACFVEEKNASLVSERHIIPIITKTPRAHFARCVDRLFTPRPLSSIGKAKIAQSASVHNSAIICADAVIGENVTIEPYVVIGPGVNVGANCHIGSHVSVSCAILKEGCTVKSQAVIGGAGFGIAHDEAGMMDIPHIGRVIIGHNCLIGSQSCIDRGQLGDTVLGNNVKIDNLVQIAHNCQIGDGSIFAGHVGVSGSCIIGQNVMLGGNVGLKDHLTIGDNVQIAARAGVMHDIPAGEIWSGIPAQPIRDHMRQISQLRKMVQKPKKEGQS